MSENILVSLLLIAYNQEKYIREAVRSALSQTFSPIEIILSDDCSIDHTYEIMKEEALAYRGPHKIIMNQNKENVGLASNLNRAWDLSSGQFIVVQAGDDISVPWRVEQLVRCWLKQEPRVDLVCSHYEEIDESGTVTGFIKKEVTYFPDMSQNVEKWRCGATGACAAYSRKLYEKYGPVDARVYMEDQVYSFRAWIESGIAVVEEPLVKHRTHGASLSVIGSSSKKIRDATLKRIGRRRGSENSLAIAEEWLRAWQIRGGDGKQEHVEDALRNLVRFRKLKLLAYDATRFEASRIALKLLLNRVSIVEVARILVRHVIRWN